MLSPPLSLYVHLPWCVRKCPYCDFNSYTAGTDAPRRRYLDALIAGNGHESRRAAGRELVSIFLGGGTPSLFPPADIAELVEAVKTSFTLVDDVEITMEANPGTVECGDPLGYREAGVNRLSIGAQSFSPGALAVLGRIHSVNDIQRAFDEARAAGFDNINLDVMHALPGQDIEAALADLEAAIELEPEHLSWYQLTLEPNTVFHARPPDGLPDNDTCHEIQLAGQALLDQHGYRQYEISAYARDGRQCRHNLNYWSFGDYLAVGAGAHGKLTDDGARRYAKPANPLSYMAAAETRELPDPNGVLESADVLFEFMLNGLRLTDGFDEALVCERTGLTADFVQRALENPIGKWLLEREKSGRIRPTALGFRFLNDLQAEFLP